LDDRRYNRLRDLIAFLIAAVACPVAVFGGSNLGCVGQGFNASCAMAAVFISPLMLIAAGVLAGLVTRGWTGLLIVLLGVLAGMVSILVLSFGVGKVVPLDPISGVIATVWFAVPMMIGYAIGRVAWRLFATRT
jgi:hypothetical protein